MTKQKVVRVTGPLAPYAAGCEEDLLSRGYSSTYGHLLLMSQMSRWLFDETLGAEDLASVDVERFAAWRRTTGHVTPLSLGRVSSLIDYLMRIGVVRVVDPVIVATPSDVLIARYSRYLADERGMSSRSIRAYVDVARTFLTWLGEDELDLEGLTTAAVSRFVVGECQRQRVASAKAVTTRLRSLLRFFYLEGLTPTALAGAVLSVAGWRQSSLPRPLDARDVARLLKSCDRRTRVGRRDFAILMVLSRLGLRAHEVAGLQLSDIDWRRGDLVIRGKGHREDRLPLPGDVGEAIVAWLRRGRAQSDVQSVFTRVRAPHGALANGSISTIVKSACARAGLPVAGAHHLRHSAASRMLQAGASLDEVAQVLRHRSVSTTSIYAKVDRRSLVAVVRVWPGGAM
jgi:integrase/recombinase XerD